MKLNLSRPLVFFDLETTGVVVGHDHIVEMCFHKVMPDGTSETRVYRVKPVDEQGIVVHIPEPTTAIHGISDADVADKPSFRQLAEEVLLFIGDADLAGYNSNKFDVPMLVEEFLRAGYSFSLSNRHLVDVQNIFHKMEQRTLKAAYRFYCSKDLDNAHSADADTLATCEVLMAQLDRYQGVDYEDKDGCIKAPIVNNVEALSKFSQTFPTVDLVGHIVYNAQHQPVFNFGKHKGKTVQSVFEVEPSYYAWMMNADFPLSTKQVLKEIRESQRAQQKLQDLKLHFQSGGAD
ncbi:MAG: 3'-5' exonuclease [Bacteroidales bacterium]|nr:3'-5' exonuclease [Candidatus Colimorpha onthohippi]